MISQIVMSIFNSPEPSGDEAVSSFFETFVPSVWMYLSSKFSSTNRRMREVLPTAASPTSDRRSRGKTDRAADRPRDRRTAQTETQTARSLNRSRRTPATEFPGRRSLRLQRIIYVPSIETAQRVDQTPPGSPFVDPGNAGPILLGSTKGLPGGVWSTR